MEWFTGLSSDLMLFYTVAAIATLILLIQLGLMVLGVGDDVETDISGLEDHGGINILSVRSMTGFFGGFGWTGVIALENGLSLLAATALGVTVGVILMLSVAYVMRVLYSLRESGNIDLQNAIGEVGTVYLPIPPRLSGPGQIRVMIQGRLKVIPAFTKVDEKIAGEKKVRVLALVDARTVLVEPLDLGIEKKREAENTK